MTILSYSTFIPLPFSQYGRQDPNNYAVFLKWRVRMNWHMLGTQAVPSTIVAFVRVVALLPWDYQGMIHPIGKSLLISRENLSVCIRTFPCPCTREIHKSGLLLVHFYIPHNIKGVLFSCNKYESKNESSYLLQA